MLFCDKGDNNIQSKHPLIFHSFFFLSCIHACGEVCICSDKYQYKGRHLKSFKVSEKMKIIQEAKYEVC